MIKQVDSANKPAKTQTKKPRFVDAKKILTESEFAVMNYLFQKIETLDGQLNLEENSQFDWAIKNILPKFKYDSRAFKFELRAKKALFGAIKSLDSSKFEGVFKYFKNFVSKRDIQGIFEKLYLSLLHDKHLGRYDRMDVLTRFYLERLIDVVRVMEPYLKEDQIEKWHYNVEPHLRRY